MDTELVHLLLFKTIVQCNYVIKIIKKIKVFKHATRCVSDAFYEMGLNRIQITITHLTRVLITKFCVNTLNR